MEILTFITIMLSFLLYIGYQLAKLEEPHDWTKQPAIKSTIFTHNRLTVTFEDGSKKVYVKTNGWWYLENVKDASNPHHNYLECNSDEVIELNNIIVTMNLNQIYK